MDLSGEYLIAAPRETVWRALNDPDILKQCIPGCESISKLSDTEMTAAVTLQIGPMKAKFTGKVTLSDLDPPSGYRISGEGQGGVAGFGKGSAEVKLEAAKTESGADATLLRYKADTQVGGKMAQLGARLIGATAKKLADQFFDKFAVLAVPAAPAATDLQPGSASAAAAAPAPDGGARLPPAVWIAGLIAIAAAILWIFTRP
jgi:carbon monoxide dehydrogenase subunit G